MALREIWLNTLQEKVMGTFHYDSTQWCPAYSWINPSKPQRRLFKACQFARMCKFNLIIKAIVGGDLHWTNYPILLGSPSNVVYYFFQARLAIFLFEKRKYKVHVCVYFMWEVRRLNREEEREWSRWRELELKIWGSGFSSIGVDPHSS